MIRTHRNSRLLELLGQQKAPSQWLLRTQGHRGVLHNTRKSRTKGEIISTYQTWWFERESDVVEGARQCCASLGPGESVHCTSTALRNSPGIREAGCRTDP